MRKKKKLLTFRSTKTSTERQTTITVIPCSLLSTEQRHRRHMVRSLDAERDNHTAEQQQIKVSSHQSRTINNLMHVGLHVGLNVGLWLWTIKKKKLTWIDKEPLLCDMWKAPYESFAISHQFSGHSLPYYSIAHYHSITSDLFSPALLLCMQRWRAEKI